MIRRSLTRFVFFLACFSTVLLVVAVMVRCTIQDRWRGFLVLYFATPWPVIAAGAAVCAAYWLWRERATAGKSRAIPSSVHGGIKRSSGGDRFTAALMIVLCLTALAAWLATGWQWRPGSNARGDLRLVHWNIDRPDLRQAGTFRWLAAQDADVISIAEREPKKKNMSARWQAAFPGYQHVPQRGETLLLVRGEVLSVRKELRSKGSFATTIRTRIRGQEVTVLQVDINGTPWVSRAEALGKIAEVAHRCRAENLIVVGDFNTPLDSAFIPPLRQEMTNAFETVGSGCVATWPTLLPVLSLDQVWTGPTLKVVRCEYASSWRSDHRAVVTEIRFGK